MKTRVPALGAAFLLCITAGMLGLSASASGPAALASAVQKPKPSPSPSGNSSGTFVKTYAALVGGTELNLAPADVAATADGGTVALALATSPLGLGEDWLVKLDAAGIPQWQEQVGCASPQNGPGDYADGTSVQQTPDGGYIVGGGAVDCGSGSTCAPPAAQQCALVEKLDSAGKLTWAQVYQVGPHGGGIRQIRQTADGGYIAVGVFLDAQQNTGAFILKLDSAGNVQWQRDLGPVDSTTQQAWFNTVQQASDGGYVAAGYSYTPRSASPESHVLVAKFGGDGSLAWQHGFATANGNGTAESVIQTSDGGYALGGYWNNSTLNGNNGAAGALLLKLNASGNLQWQQAYSGGVHCFFNGYSETCADIGGSGYSLHQTADGGYVLAGTGDLELVGGGVQIEPWLEKADATGTLVWQHLYYQTYAPTGAPLGEFFPAATTAPGDGSLAVGPTEDVPAQKDLLFAVRADSSGLAGTSCPDAHPATPLQAIDPQRTAAAPARPLNTATTPAVPSPIATAATSISTQQDC